MKLGIAVLVISALVIGRSTASPLTFYSDQAAWEAAVSGGSQVGDVPATVTEVFTIAETNSQGFCCKIVDTMEVTGPGGFGEDFSFNFAALGQTVDAECFAVPNCSTLPPVLTELIFQFNVSVLGFSSADAILEDETGIGLVSGAINGQAITGPFASFFGVTGGVSSLDFAPTCLLCDSMPDEMRLSDIVVVIASEPATSACLLAAILIFVAAQITVSLSTHRTMPHNQSAGMAWSSRESP